MVFGLVWRMVRRKGFGCDVALGRLLAFVMAFAKVEMTETLLAYARALALGMLKEERWVQQMVFGLDSTTGH